MKRGQVTLFIILGIFLLLVFVYLYSTVSTIKKNIEPAQLRKSESVDTLIRTCNKMVSLKAAYVLAANGGHYPMPTDYTQFHGYNATYTYWLTKPQPIVILPPDEMVRDYARYVTENLPVCVQNFEYFKEQGLDITQGAVSTTVEIMDDKVLVDVKYPVKVTSANSNYELLEFPTVTVPVRLGLMYAASEKITQWLADEQYIPSTKIDKLMQQLNMQITIDTIGSTAVFVIYDEDSSIEGNYSYVFGARYD